MANNLQATAATTVVTASPVRTSGIANAVLLNDAVAKKVFTPIISIPIFIINQPVPDASTQHGNLFNDRFNNNTLWYVPAFTLPAGTDAGFSFIATQSTLPNSSGDPFYMADLKFTLHKDVPADATAAQAANAAINLKEIQLQSLQVILSIAYSDDQGNPAFATYNGSITPAGDGSYQVHVANVIANHVVLLYENLTMFASAQISLSATFNAWRPTGTSRIMLARNIMPVDSPGEMPERPMVRTAFAGQALQATNFRFVQPIRPVNPGSGFNENQTFSQALALTNKYAGNGYQLSYKINAPAGIRPIINVEDLKNLKGNPTEFSELKTIDLSKYPSISALYMGVLSRVIIIIPRSYGIVRNALTCSASCWASVDTTPGGVGTCKFQFQFELTPDVDAVDYIQLFKEIQQNADLQSYSLQFAGSLKNETPSTLNSAFTTGTAYQPATTPQNFILVTSIVDAPGQSSVVNANLLIQQLCRVSPGCAIGNINLKLDDNYPNPVSSTVALSLPGAKSDDGISWAADTDAQTVKFTNTTSFDFLLQRYTFCSDAGIGDTVEANLAIASGATVSVPLPQNFTHLSIITDYIEQTNGPVDRTNIARYMEIKTQDAQNVQYFIGTNSSQVRYAFHNIDQINVQPLLTTASTVSVPSFSMAAQNTAAGTNIMLPLQFSITSLPATLAFTVSFKDGSKDPLSFTKQNDFIVEPIFDVVDADITT